jgi:hypothetical protein
MAGYRPARGGVLETMADYYERRQREVAHFGEQAAAVAREAYGRALRAGEDLDLPTAGDVVRYGADLLAGKKGPPTPPTSRPPPKIGGAKAEKASARKPAPAPSGTPGNWFDGNEVVKAAAGDVVRNLSLAPGVARGAWDTARDVADGVLFASRLFDPLDAEHNPRGEAAWDKVFQGANGLAREVEAAVADPRSVVDSVRNSLERFNARVDPRATPVADTFAGEMRRQAGLGLNQGEFLFDAGSVFYGGAQAKALSRLGKVAEATGAEKYLARGIEPGLADYFATPYTGIGHHYLPRRTRLPQWLGGGPVPSVIGDSPFFLLKPEGISTGDMMELHYKVDPKYGGGKIPAEFGGGSWSGETLGWEKYDRLGRLWHGAPLPLKVVAGSGVVGAGAFVDQVDGGEGSR